MRANTEIAEEDRALPAKLMPHPLPTTLSDTLCALEAPPPILTVETGDIGTVRAPCLYAQVMRRGESEQAQSRALGERAGLTNVGGRGPIVEGAGARHAAT
jgi:hypothetical protein